MVRRLRSPAMALLVLLTCLAAAQEAGTDPVTVGTAACGIWAPELHELHVRIPLTIRAALGDDVFSPRQVLVDGAKPTHAFWMFDGTPFDYEAIARASQCRKIEVFVPLFWRGGERHAVELKYVYGGREFTQSVTVETPAGSGAWARAAGPGNATFRVVEEYGLARMHEIVEFDVVVETSAFPDAVGRVRATRMEAATHREIPCQTYAVEAPGRGALIRFRAAVPLTVPVGGVVTVCLWNVADAAPAAPSAGPLERRVEADAEIVENAFYSIRMSPLSGQFMTWDDKALKTRFDYVDPRKLEESARVINRTPDVYRPGTTWSHALDWKTGEYQRVMIRGPVFLETIRWGKLPFLEEFSGKVQYRFEAARGAVSMSSVLSVDRDTTILAFRNGGISLTPSLFTHAAWPRQNGEVVKLPLTEAQGNDTGSPSASRMSVDTPWVALYHVTNRTGIALLTTRLAYYHKGGHHPNTSRMQSYVSVYRGYTVYTIRSMNQTYCANIRSLPVPVKAGTELYEAMVFVPFTMRDEPDPFFEVTDEYRRRMNPLVVTP